jgi:hypothetical protein
MMLKQMEDLELFDRSNGLDPFLLRDGHDSRVEEPFVGMGIPFCNLYSLVFWLTLKVKKRFL